METTLDASYDDVYIGAWVDRSKSSIDGAHLTVTSTNGAVLVAFLALFVQYTGQQLWGILCFAWHQIRASKGRKNVLQYQQDVSLRNNVEPAQTLFYFAQIAWSWRHVRKQSAGWQWWRLVVFPIAAPLTYLILLIAAGILSSSIVETSSVDVLRRGKYCGLWKIPDQDDFSSGTFYQNQFMVENSRYIARTLQSSRIYAQACYNQTDPGASPICHEFTRPAIKSTSNIDVPCPFNSTTCVLENNLRIDTGDIDTNVLLGINTNQHNIKFRKTITCAPLGADLFAEKSDINVTTPQGTNHEYQVRLYWGNAARSNKTYTAVFTSIAAKLDSTYTVA